MTLLLRVGVAEEKELYEAQKRVARAAIKEMEERRKRKRAGAKRKQWRESN